MACTLACCADAADVDASPRTGAEAGARAESARSNNEVRGTPTFYLDRKIVSISGDRNRLLDGYREAVDNCQDAGHETTPLGPEDEARVGTERWQLWRNATSVSWRRDAWEAVGGDLDAGTMCRFTLDLKGEHVRVERGQTVVLDLGTGERSVDEGDPSLFDVPAADPPGDDPGNDGEPPVTRSVAGQPCFEWRHADGSTTCVWSGGLVWGYAAEASGPFSSLSGIVPMDLVLQASPAAGKTGDRLETTRFIVGGQLPPGDTVPPAGRDLL